MKKIKVEKISEEELKSKGILSWPIWEKEESRFDWHYDSAETCYILEGKAAVFPDSGEGVEFGPGDLVVFPEGLDCVWIIKEKIKKHYNF
ncbi:cupin domain-containing protein [Elusimicrobiota bacterium]